MGFRRSFWRPAQLILDSLCSLVMHHHCGRKSSQTDTNDNHGCIDRCIDPSAALDSALYVKGENCNRQDCRGNDSHSEWPYQRDGSREIRLCFCRSGLVWDCTRRLRLRWHHHSRTIEVLIGVISLPIVPGEAVNGGTPSPITTSNSIIVQAVAP
jgi:hypothetical protein